MIVSNWIRRYYAKVRSEMIMSQGRLKCDWVRVTAFTLGTPFPKIPEKKKKIAKDTDRYHRIFRGSHSSIAPTLHVNADIRARRGRHLCSRPSVRTRPATPTPHIWIRRRDVDLKSPWSMPITRHACQGRMRAENAPQRVVVVRGVRMRGWRRIWASQRITELLGGRWTWRGLTRTIFWSGYG